MGGGGGGGGGGAIKFCLGLHKGLGRYCLVICAQRRALFHSISFVFIDGGQHYRVRALIYFLCLISICMRTSVRIPHNVTWLCRFSSVRFVQAMN